MPTSTVFELRNVPNKQNSALSLFSLCYHIPFTILISIQLYILVQYLETVQFWTLIFIFIIQNIKKSYSQNEAFSIQTLICNPTQLIKLSYDWLKFSFLLSLLMAFIPSNLILLICKFFIYICFPTLGLLRLYGMFNYFWYYVLWKLLNAGFFFFQ